MALIEFPQTAIQQNLAISILVEVSEQLVKVLVKVIRAGLLHPPQQPCPVSGVHQSVTEHPGDFMDPKSLHAVHLLHSLRH